jgi:hypothetical protein
MVFTSFRRGGAAWVARGVGPFLNVRIGWTAATL